MTAAVADDFLTEWGAFAKGCAQLVILLLRLSSVGSLRLAGDGHASVVGRTDGDDE